jgi:ketosteroid isomerase-like protein
VSRDENIKVVLECFAAVEQRDEKRQRQLFHPDVEFHWPPSLLDSRRTEDGARSSFEEVWDPLQPTGNERSMDPRIVAAGDDEVVVLWQQRGLDAKGTAFECPVLGLYEVREGKLARAQMFYFDTIATAEFLSRAP